MSRVRNFLYRFPRFAATCRMDFIHGDAVVLGTCVNLSQSGLRGVFAGEVSPGAEGLLTLYNNQQKVEIKARIDSLEDDEARVEFLFESDLQRTAVREMIKLITTPVSR